MAKITYLIANYNQEQYIKECIFSLKEQTNPNWQALIYDDCSTDTSIEIINNNQHSNIKLYQGSENRKKSYGLNYLVDKSETEILAILDPDDCLFPQTTDEILKVYKQKPATKWLYTKYQEMSNDFSKILRIRGEKPPLKQSFLLFGKIAHIISFKKDTFKKIGGFNSKMLYSEDRDFIYKLEEQARAEFIPQPLYKYRRTSNSATTSKQNRNLGAKNHLLSQKNAIKRRQIIGMQKFFYVLFFFLISQWYPYRYPLFIRGVFWIIYKCLLFILRPFLRLNNY